MSISVAPNRSARSAVVVLIALLISTPVALAQDGTEKWKFRTWDSVLSYPAIGADGTIYVGSFDNLFYAINPDGTQKWAFATGGHVRNPAIGSDGTIYITSMDDNLYAINPDGSPKWVFPFVDYGAALAIGVDGTVYVASQDWNLYAIDPDGTQKWVFTAADDLGRVTIGPDGTIYAGEDMTGSNFYAINPDGTQKWVFSQHRPVSSSPAIGADGTVYVGSGNGRLFALNPDGTSKWEFHTGGNTKCPAIGADGTIYVGHWGTSVSSLYAINPDGTEKWEFPTGDWVTATPAIGADGTIYVGSYDKNLYAINPDGTEKWAFQTGDIIQSSAAIGTDGTIYVGSYDQYLYAINGSSGGLANSPWPMYHRDVRHTGRATGPCLDIDVNGQDFDFSVPHTTQLDVTLSLAPGDYQGVRADWWIFVTKDSTHDFWWRWPGNWTYSSTPLRALNMGLLSVNNYTLAQTTLPVGTWDFTFALDSSNNVYEGTFNDTIKVTTY